jgi:hypothetical protein
MTSNITTKHKTALILEGGAMRGLYSAGIIDVFMQYDVKVDVIYGVSAGALFGLNYKSRQIGRAIRYNLKYAKEKNYKSKTTKTQNEKIQYIKDKDTYDFIFPEKYHNKNDKSIIIKTTSKDGKTINLYSNNKREVIFQSGVRKEIFPDGYHIVYFTNGDLKQIFPEGKTVYYFFEAKTVQTNFNNGLQVFRFNNGQIEKHFPDGNKEIFFPDGSHKFINFNGYEETLYSDGTIQKIDKNNNLIVELKDGTKEIKYADGREERILPNKNIESVDCNFLNENDDNENNK